MLMMLDELPAVDKDQALSCIRKLVHCRESSINSISFISGGNNYL